MDAADCFYTITVLLADRSAAVYIRTSIFFICWLVVNRGAPSVILKKIKSYEV